MRVARPALAAVDDTEEEPPRVSLPCAVESGAYQQTVERTEANKEGKQKRRSLAISLSRSLSIVH